MQGISMVQTIVRAVYIQDLDFQCAGYGVFKIFRLAQAVEGD